MGTPKDYSFVRKMKRKILIDLRLKVGGVCRGKSERKPFLSSEVNLIIGIHLFAANEEKAPPCVGV